MHDPRSGPSDPRAQRAQPRAPLTDALADRLNIAALLWACAVLGMMLPPLDQGALFDGRLITTMFVALVWVPAFAMIFQAIGWHLAMPTARSLRGWALPDEPRWTRAFETTVAALWPLALVYWLITAPGLRLLDSRLGRAGGNGP
jgi:TRAP-type C4-dicarboxylate transport system permease large subunit